VRERNECLEKIKNTVIRLTGIHQADEKSLAAANLSKASFEYSRPERPDELGALKRFNIREDDPNAQKAVARFKREVEVLGGLREPGILQLLQANAEERWMITEYHPGGTLAGQPRRYKGSVLAALEAFRPLVASVAGLHAVGVVHRDIKPSNLFVAADGRLVLGDFGIVYFEDDRQERLTDTFERVGARDWMAPWADTGVRIDDVKLSFDVFSPGKVLWSMVSGRPRLPLWYYARDEHNVEKLFPGEPNMAVINVVLKRCVVENERDCLPTAKELQECVDEWLRTLRGGGQLLEDGAPRYCQTCGKGRYPRGSPQNRPLRVTSKPAIGSRPRTLHLIPCRRWFRQAVSSGGRPPCLGVPVSARRTRAVMRWFLGSQWGSRRGRGGNVEIASWAISKGRWERWETVVWFSTFSTAPAFPPRFLLPAWFRWDILIRWRRSWCANCAGRT